MEEPGLRLKLVRERLNLRYRDVEEASIQIANRRRNDEFVIQLSRLSDIENKGTVPSIYRLYSLCTIYRLEVADVLEWYGVDLSFQGPDAMGLTIEKTHLVGFGANRTGEVQIPLTLDPGIDPRKTSYLSRQIQKWGKLPLTLLDGVEIRNHRYGFIGSEDWSMYPLIPPDSLILIDESLRKIVSSGWSNEFERPVYFFEHRGGYACMWCTLHEGQLLLQPHPASMRAPEIYKYPGDIDVIGQVTGVAMHLDQAKRRRTHA